MHARTRMPAMSLDAFLYCMGVMPRVNSRTSRRPALRARYSCTGCAQQGKSQSGIEVKSCIVRRPALRARSSCTSCAQRQTLIRVS